MKYLDDTGLMRLWNKITTRLAGKQASLVSGVNIKTINSQSLLGSGNINIQGGGGGGSASIQQPEVYFDSLLSYPSAFMQNHKGIQLEVGKELEFLVTGGDTTPLENDLGQYTVRQMNATEKSVAQSVLSQLAGTSVTINSATYISDLDNFINIFMQGAIGWLYATANVANIGEMILFYDSTGTFASYTTIQTHLVEMVDIVPSFFDFEKYTDVLVQGDAFLSGNVMPITNVYNYKIFIVEYTDLRLSLGNLYCYAVRFGQNINFYFPNSAYLIITIDSYGRIIASSSGGIVGSTSLSIQGLYAVKGGKV